MNRQRAVKRSQLQKGDGSLIRHMGSAGIPPFLKTPIRVTMRVPRRCSCRASSIHRSLLNLPPFFEVPRWDRPFCAWWSPWGVEAAKGAPPGRLDFGGATA